MNRFSEIQQKLLSPAKIAVLEVFIDENDNKQFSLTHYEKKKDSVQLTDDKINIGDEESLLKELKDKAIPLLLCVDGKGILIKKMPVSEEPPENLIQRIIPNAKAEDFYVEQVIGAEDNSFVSLIRRSSLKSLIDEIIKRGFFICHLNIGPAVSSCISGTLTTGDTFKELSWRNYSLTFSPEGLHELSKKTQSEDSTLPFESKHFLKFSAAVAYFSGWREMNSTLLCEEIGNSSLSFTQKRKFVLYSYSLVFFFLIALLSNFFIFQHYWSRQQQLESELGWQESAVKNYEGLKKTINEKMSFAVETGLLTEEKLAWLADQLGASVPENVKLTRLNIYPREKKITEEDETYIFNQKSIVLTGNSESEGILNDWIKEIKEKEFAGKVRLASFLQNEEKKTGVFTLEIDLK